MCYKYKTRPQGSLAGPSDGMSAGIARPRLQTWLDERLAGLRIRSNRDFLAKLNSLFSARRFERAIPKRPSIVKCLAVKGQHNPENAAKCRESEENREKIGQRLDLS